MEDKKNGILQYLFSPQAIHRMLVLWIIVILLFSFFGGVIASSGGRIAMEEVRFDTRGGILTAELYTPRGVSSSDKLPAIMVLPGGGCTYRVTSGISQELARRGFVVLNVNVYGSGNSENPFKDDMGLEPGVFYATRGAKDAYAYLRSLVYVDQERIGMAGHSMGGLRTGGAASNDASYFTLNDLLINNLTEIFGIQLSYEEIEENADDLAKKYLNGEKMDFYDFLKKENIKYYNERVKSWFAIGSGASLAAKKVNVGGHEVIREPQVNIGFSIGFYDETSRTKTFRFPPDKPTTYEGVTTALAYMFQTQGKPFTPGVWYEVQPGYGLNDEPRSTIIGEAAKISADNNQALSRAIQNRSARVFFFTYESHSRNFFSKASAQNVVHFMVDTLGYNNGNLGASNTRPIPYTNIIFFFRIACNFISMLGMFAMLITLAAILIKRPYFTGCALPAPVPLCSKRNIGFWIVSGVIAAVGAWAVLYVGGSDLGFENKFIKASLFFPFGGIPLTTASWLIWVDIATIISLVAYSFINKDISIKKIASSLGINIKFSTVMKYLLIALIIVSAGYVSLLVVKAAFNQHYRLWLSAFDVMSTARVTAWIRYFLLALPLFFVSNCMINIGKMKDMKEGWNLFICILFSILGVLVVAIVNYTYMYTTNLGPITTFFCTQWSLFLMIPVTGIIARKLYNLSGSVWLGTFVNALMISWMWVSTVDNAVYTGASVLARYFGL